MAKQLRNVSPLRLEDLRLTDTVIVIGGDGFLGSHIVDYLVRIRKGPNSPPVHVLDLQQRYPDRPHVKYHIGSLLDQAFLVTLFKQHGITCVVHTASPPHGKSTAFYRSVNVEGTESLVMACIKTGVRKLVYTSSASVVFNGADVFEATEDLLYCRVPLDSYTETKALAEDLVLKSNNIPTVSDTTLLTCALRPSGIFGPRDGQMLPGFLETIEQGKSAIVLGNGLNLFDFTYVENVAYAHLLAIVQLERGKGVDGRAFNITNDEPIPFWELPRRLIRSLLPLSDARVAKAGSRHIPRTLALILAYIATTATLILGLVFPVSPSIFTPFRVRLATATRTFSCARAKLRLGYRPLWTIDEGIAKSLDWIRTQDRWAHLWQSPKMQAHQAELDSSLKEE